jgi:glycosyltransferase involved in cell wall biosynthesis
MNRFINPQAPHAAGLAKKIPERYNGSMIDATTSEEKGGEAKSTPSQEGGLSVIIPCHNEAATLPGILRKLTAVLPLHEIIVVDDASTDETGEFLRSLDIPCVRVIRHETKMGYGASLKSGILASRFSWIGITDADGTYPVEELVRFLSFRDRYDMIVGARVGIIRKIPLIRRPAKWLINRLASYIARRKIPDVNSGLRLFQKEITRQYWTIFPDGFSFTTTLTLAMYMGRYRIHYIPIDYLKRSGKSKIHPVKDTYQFILLILRLAMLFDPLRIFMPPFFFTAFLAFISLIRDIVHLNLAETTVTLFVASILLLMLGLLADLINKKFPWKHSDLS